LRDKFSSVFKFLVWFRLRVKKPAETLVRGDKHVKEENKKRQAVSLHGNPRPETPNRVHNKPTR